MMFTVEITPAVRIAALLIPVIALPIIVWAAAHESRQGKGRLLALLLAFTGAMELLVLAGDLFTLIFAWELVGGLSWALIGHQWNEAGKMPAAAYAFNMTRFGGLGLWFAAGAAVAVTGGFGYDGLDKVVESSWATVFAVGILVAAASKSAQAVFAPWLFRAMEGPSSVSALLHSSTMVAAGVWLLIRLHEPLAAIPWFGPAVMIVGLGTALAGGAVALLQVDAKKLLAASTSAQYGLMFVAVGAGYASAALAHLVGHALFKALLFLAAGVAIGAAGSHDMRQMRLGRRLPITAAASLVGALALAAIPPLGGAWSKEQVVAAAGHHGPWLALLVIGAGALSAAYAARFQLQVFGRRPRRNDGGRKINSRPPLAELSSIWLLAGLSLLLGIAWLPGGKELAETVLPGHLPSGKLWELIVSAGTVSLVAGGVWLRDRRRARAAATQPSSPADPPARRDSGPASDRAADWLGLAWLIDRGFTRPTVGLAYRCARFDDRVVDAGVRGAAWIGRRISALVSRLLEAGIDGVVFWIARGGLGSAAASRVADERGVDRAVDSVGGSIGSAGRSARRAHPGSIPVYYSIVIGGLLILLIALLVWP